MILAGTGHRPQKLGGYGQHITDKLIAVATQALQDLSPDVVISGMALGWDQALALAAISLNIPMHAYIPFEGQESMWPETSQKKFREILSCAQRVKVVSEGAYHPSKMQIRNEAMVDDCDVVLALWDGTKGGTGNCVKYAQKVGKRIENYWNVFEAL